MRKILIFICIIATLCTTLASCGVKEPSEAGGTSTPPATKTNEELIEERITAFLTAYNNGDMEGTMACLTTKNRNEMQALLDLLGGLSEALTGFSIDLSDLFSLGVAMESDDYMKLNIQKIEIENSLSAVATATMELANEGEEAIYFIMAYENGGWYIEDMTDKTTSDDSESASSPLDDIDTAFLNERTASQGLSFRLSDDKSYYILDGFGSCQDTHIVVPEYPVEYNDLPVKEISLSVNPLVNTNDIEYITIPKTVTHLRISAQNLKAIHYLGDLEDFFNVQSKIYGPSNGLGGYTWDKTALYTNGVLLEGELKIPSDVEKIYDENFHGYRYITSLILEGNTQIGNYAFSYCWGLTSVNLENFNGNIGNNAFYYCSELKELKLGNSKSELSLYAFDCCYNLIDISGGDSLRAMSASSFLNTAYVKDESKWEQGIFYIGNWLYQIKNDVIHAKVKDGTVGIVSSSHYDRKHYSPINAQSGLTTIELPTSLKHIGNGAFEYAYSLTLVKYAGTAEDWNSIYIGENNSYLTNLIDFIINPKTNQMLFTKQLHFKESTYAILSNVRNWNDAKSFCELLGGHLATLTTKEENNAIYEYITLCKKDNVYFGLSDVEKEGEWKWVTGETFEFENWESTEPNGNTSENYAQFYTFNTTPTWHDASGAMGSWDPNLTYICEWDSTT